MSSSPIGAYSSRVEDRNTVRGQSEIPRIPPGYRGEHIERMVQEPEKFGWRSPFSRDRARVLHSAALRRLAAKTQIVPPWNEDFPRTRLTHSLEVAQIGRELGQALGADPDLVETACLAHDLGHPPYGHNGEVALARWLVNDGGFEGNAQTLRVLARLEAKVALPTGDSAGLNLTRAALAAAIKYPWGFGQGPDPSSPKFGVYVDDLPTFSFARAGAVLPVQAHLTPIEAQVMDWADDVAYSVHDVEDAVHSGRWDPAWLSSATERDALLALATSRYASALDGDQCAAALARLQGATWWPVGFDGSHRGLTALKAFTSSLIGRFCLSAEEETRRVHGPDRLVGYAAGLIVADEVRAEVAVLKAVADKYVMQASGAPERYLAEQDLLLELLDAILRGAPESLDPQFRGWFAEADTAGDPVSARRRVVADQVASLSDPTARVWHARLCQGRAQHPVGPAAPSAQTTAGAAR